MISPTGILAGVETGRGARKFVESSYPSNFIGYLLKALQDAGP